MHKVLSKDRGDVGLTEEGDVCQKLIRGSPRRGRSSSWRQAECAWIRMLVTGILHESWWTKITLAKSGSQIIMDFYSYAKEFILYLLCQENPPGASSTDVERCGSWNALAAVRRFEWEILGADRPEGGNIPRTRGKGNEEILKALGLPFLDIRIIFRTG